MRVYDLLYVSHRIAGILGAPQRTLSQAEIADAFDALNAMLDSWNTERLMIYSITRQVHPLVASQQIYTIGASISASFNTTRPPTIEKASILDEPLSAQPRESPIEIVTALQWQNIPIKTTLSPFPDMLWYDAAYPLGKIHLYPVPSETNSLVLYPWTQFSQFAAVTDTVAFPSAYLRAIQYNLAVELAPRYPSTRMSPMVIPMAIEAKAAVKNLNAPILDLACDSALIAHGGAYDIWVG
jgi:hypothetical protein